MNRPFLFKALLLIGLLPLGASVQEAGERRPGVRPFGLQFQGGDKVELNVSRLFDGPDDTFEIVPGVEIPADRYWWDRVEIQYEGSNVRPFVFRTEASMGSFYTGNRVDLKASLLARLQPHYEFTLEYERNDIELIQGSFVTNVARLRADFAVNARLTVTGFAQYDDQSERGALVVKYTQYLRM